MRKAEHEWPAWVGWPPGRPRGDRGMALTTGTGCAQLGWKERTGQARDLGSMPRAEGGSRHSAASCPHWRTTRQERQLGAREESPACEDQRLLSGKDGVFEWCLWKREAASRCHPCPRT